MITKLNLEKTVVLAACALVIAGCAQQQQRHKYKAAPMTATKSGGVMAYFPSGRAEGSGLLLEKTAPAEVLAGQPYQYSYKVSNLTDATLENVMVTDRVGNNFMASDSAPKATSMADGVALELGQLRPQGEQDDHRKWLQCQ